ncbi:putative pyridoxal 5'-phosphate synthase (glutamine hydrolyzing) [Helianthus annuus]|nr:putative pyridoxal 5'-phosphate synthase (glutamine hydrolyzing) [Helianthus annuus]
MWNQSNPLSTFSVQQATDETYRNFSIPTGIPFLTYKSSRSTQFHLDISSNTFQISISLTPFIKVSLTHFIEHLAGIHKSSRSTQFHHNQTVKTALFQSDISSNTLQMADESAVTVYGNTAITDPSKNNNKNNFSVKVGLAQMLRGGAIIEVTTVDQAKIAESAGACCVIVSEPPGSGIQRMLDPAVVKQIQRSVNVPVMAKARVGHFVEAQILEAVGVDYIDENELDSVADEDHFINKHNFQIPFVCGCGSLGEGLRRVREGAAMIRTQGDRSGSGNIAETVKHVRDVMGKIRVLTNMDEDEVFTFAKELGAPYDILAQTKQMGRLPVVHFASGGIVTPADAALMMQLGCDGVFVGSEVFNSVDPYKSVRAIVQAVRNYNDAHILAKVSSGLNDVVASSSEVADVMTSFNLDP